MSQYTISERQFIGSVGMFLPGGTSFGLSFICKSTNSEFIALIADKLSLQLKSSEVANF